MRMPPKKKAPADLPSTMSTARFELGLEILSELDVPSIMSLLETNSLQGEVGESEAGAIMGLLGSALKGRMLRRLSAVAVATEDELEAAEASEEKMAELVQLRGRAGWLENFQAVKGFFSQLGISNLATLASSIAPMAKQLARGEDQPGEPSPSGG